MDNTTLSEDEKKFIIRLYDLDGALDIDELINHFRNAFPSCNLTDRMLEQECMKGEILAARKRAFLGDATTPSPSKNSGKKDVGDTMQRFNDVEIEYLILLYQDHDPASILHATRLFFEAFPSSARTEWEVMKQCSTGRIYELRRKQAPQEGSGRSSMQHMITDEERELLLWVFHDMQCLNVDDAIRMFVQVFPHAKSASKLAAVRAECALGRVWEAREALMVNQVVVVEGDDADGDEEMPVSPVSYGRRTARG